MLTYQTHVHELLLGALAYATDAAPPSGDPLRSVLPTEPLTMQNAVADLLGADWTVVVTGSLDRRLVLLRHRQDDEWTVADLSGQPHASRDWPAWTTDHIQLAEPDNWLSTARVTAEGERRLLRPRVLLVSLYHPETFPLPRFPLAISDLARAARATLLGRVELMDMQLDATLQTILGRIADGEVEILGVSATFGQHDLMTRLLDEVTRLDQPPMLIAGGSLTVRNERTLLDQYPNLIISRGAGESTIADAMAYWHGDLTLSQIRGVGYRSIPAERTILPLGRPHGRIRHTAAVANRTQTDMAPELDLLDRTLSRHGVAQLETSRGCTNYCSFCPRGHKGQWAGTTPQTLARTLRDISIVFDRHPEQSRTVYLVDEEFIGRDPDAPARALAIADTLAQAGFAWETSCRIDQVVHTDRDRNWHIHRGHLWRDLVDRRLRRCLFGVESGVTSILDRFNKDTTGEQNALAIRTLTALGVPPRFTYITFDQLMTYDELRATYAFQSRDDLLLRPQPDLTVEEIVDGVHDETWVARHTTSHPFYTAISYPLVTMECLIGAAYTHRAQAAGLTGEADPSMGRVEARFADPRIGVLARWAQLWIDRNFALDYTLKSLEKIIDGLPYRTVRDARRILKGAAYQLLGDMIAVAEGDDLDSQCARLANRGIESLQTELAPGIAAAQRVLPDDQRAVLQREYIRWVNTDTWRLINAADPCGT
jgi:Radical SAM superfamily